MYTGKQNEAWVATHQFLASEIHCSNYKESFIAAGRERFS